MKILVLLRFSDVIHEFELNPLIVANMLKKKEENSTIDCVTMDRIATIDKMEVCCDYNIDHIYILNDSVFAGSDTFMTSYVLYQYIKDREYDLILSSYMSKYGETTHVPISLAALWNVPFAINVFDITSIHPFVCKQKLEHYNESVCIPMPCVISIGNIISEELELDGMPSLFQTMDSEQNITVLNAKDIDVVKSEDIDIFTQVYSAEKIVHPKKEKRDVTDVGSAKKIILDHINYNKIKLYN